jgi:hypothetical protein
MVVGLDWFCVGARSVSDRCPCLVNIFPGLALLLVKRVLLPLRVHSLPLAVDLIQIGKVEQFY